MKILITEEKREIRRRAAEEEARKIEAERLAKLESERLERERIERERLATIARLEAIELERTKVVAYRELLAKKRAGLAEAEKEYQRRVDYWNHTGHHLYKHSVHEWTTVEKQGYVVRDLKHEIDVMVRSGGN